MANISLPVSVRIQIPKGLSDSNLERKVLMKGLSDAGRKIKTLSKHLLNVKNKGVASNPSEFPRRVTGCMWRHVKVHKAKKKDRYWVRVQIDSIENEDFWYPAALMNGSTKRNIKPRKDAIWEAHRQLEQSTTTIVEASLAKSIKGWF
jgi:hypothetical protein